MNAEQLNAVCKELQKEISTQNLIARLQKLQNLLDKAISQPNQPQLHVDIAKHRDELTNILSSVEEQERTVTKKQIIEEIGGTNILGGALLKRIQDSFTQNEVTLGVVSKDIGEMHAELSNFSQGIDQLIVGFDRFNIGFEELAPYTAELGILIPRREGKEDLKFFAKDIAKLDQELQVFSELATGEAARYQIRTISSSDFSIFLNVSPITTGLIISIIWGLMVGYDKLLDIRLKRQELKKLKAPDPIMKGTEEWAEGIMEKVIGEITVDVMKQYKDVQRARW